MHYPKIFSLLILFALVFGCTEDDMADVEVAERQYAALYLAIKQGDPQEAKQAAREFERKLQGLGLHWIAPGSEGSEDVFRFRSARARKAWEATRAAIDEDNLPLAALQLDRATYELSNAHPASFDDLPMGRFYRLLSGWASLVSILEDEQYCGFGWEEIHRYHAGVARNLEAVKNVPPKDLFYAATAQEVDRYRRMLGELESRLTAMIRSINFEDRVLILADLDHTDQKITELLEFFARGGAQTVQYPEI